MRLVLALVAAAAAGDAPRIPEARAIVPIPLTDGEGPLGEAIARAFVRPMLSVKEGAPTPPFAWGKFDVTGSGYGEIFLSFRSPGQCGEAGCPLLVMERKPDGAWRPIMSAVATSVSGVRRGKAADLVVAGEAGRTTTWSWDAARRTMTAAP